MATSHTSGSAGMKQGAVRSTSMTEYDEFKQTDPTPGFKHLFLKVSLSTNQGHLDYKKAVMTSIEKAQSGPHRFAMKNLRGIFAYQERKIAEAISIFKDILEPKTVSCEGFDDEGILSIYENDTENLNAIASLESIYKDLNCPEKAEIYSDLLKRALSTSGLGEKSEFMSRKARCWFEQGYMISFDVQEDSQPGSRWKENLRGYKYYEKALELGGDDVKELEKMEWQYYKVYSLNQLYSVEKALEEIGLNRESAYTQMITLLCEVSQSKKADKYYRSQAWSLLGTILQKTPTRHKNHKNPKDCQHFQPPAVIKRLSLQTMFSDPEQCFYMSKGFYSKCVHCLNRHARYLHFRSKECCRNREDAEDDFKRAVELLKTSLKLDNSATNWFAAYCLGSFLRGRYKDLWYAHISKGTSKPAKELAKEAKDNLLQALEKNPTPAVYADVAEMCHFLSIDQSPKSDKRNVVDEDEAIAALIFFKQAVENLDGCTYPDIHQRRGRLLKDMGYLRSSIESFKRTVETQKNGSKHVDGFVWLLELLLENYMEEKRNQTGHVDFLLGDVTYWFHMGVSIHDKETLKKKIIDKVKVIQPLRKHERDVCDHLVKREFKEASDFLADILKSNPPPDGAFQDSGSPTGESLYDEGESTNEEITPDIEGAPLFKRSWSTDETQPSGLPDDVETDAVFQADASSTDAEGQGHPSVSPSGTIKPPERKWQEPRSELKREIPKAPLEAKSLNYSNDFYVIYSKDARHWVNFSLLTKLEMEYHLKGHVDFRDFTPGMSEPECISGAINDSYRTLVVVSKGSSTDPWFSYQLDFALTNIKKNRKYPIPIVLEKPEDCSTPEVPDRIQMIVAFDRHPFTGVYDWEKLYKAIQ